MVIGYENQFLQLRNGVLDPETYAAYERSISTQFLAFRGFRVWWQQSRSVFTPDFVAHVDAMIAEVPEIDPGAFLREWQAIALDTAPETPSEDRMLSPDPP
jgi:hypothetical protein